MELYGSPTTKELEKSLQSGRRGRDLEQAVPHPRVDKNQEGSLRSKRSQNPGFQCQEDKSPQLLAAKTSGRWGSGRN